MAIVSAVPLSCLSIASLATGQWLNSVNHVFHGKVEEPFTPNSVIVLQSTALTNNRGRFFNLGRIRQSNSYTKGFIHLLNRGAFSCIDVLNSLIEISWGDDDKLGPCKKLCEQETIWKSHPPNLSLQESVSSQ